MPQFAGPVILGVRLPICNSLPVDPANCLEEIGTERSDVDTRKQERITRRVFVCCQPTDCKKLFDIN